ncbi:unnamed protein product [Schistosoma turkestanicum]|nr:unnamed protein product [Schistosoma turkestanicum]
MDTSMEDLFSDFDKSTVFVETAGVKKNNTEQRDLIALTTETIGNEVIQIEGVYQASTRSLCVTIELHQNSLLSGCINLEIPYQYPSPNANLSGTKNVPIKICTLCDNSRFTNIITYPQHQNSTVFADLSSTSSSFSSIFVCSKRFINILCDNTENDDPDLVRLCGLPNGLVYAIWYSTVNKQLHYSVVFPLSCCKPIVAWAFIRNPVAHSTTSYTIGSTFKNNPCIQTENNTVNDLLVGLTKDGEGVGVWFDSLDVCSKTVLNITEFSLPQSPDPITKCRAQGSWLHVITQSGYLMSIHFSLQLKQSIDKINVNNNNNHNKSTKWNLLCQPTNFPRLPIHLSPVNNIEQWIKSCPKWRNLNVCDFTRLADGHLGSIDSQGRKTRLVDLLSSKSEINTPINYTEQQLNQTFMDLIKTKYQMKSYLACLLLLNRLSDLKVNTDEGDWSQFPLNCKVYLTSRHANHESGNQSPLELIVDITAPNTPIDHNLNENFNELLLSHSNLTKINLNHLTQIILFQLYTNNNNNNTTNNWIISDYLVKYLYIIIKMEIVQIADCESPSLSSNIISEEDNNTGDNYHQHSLVYTYRELWFSSLTTINHNDHSKLRRCIIPSSHWSQIFHMLELNNSSHSQHGRFLTSATKTLRVNVQLEFQPPMLPQHLFCSHQFNEQLFENVKKIDHSPILVTIGDCHLDCIHFLYGMKNNSLLKSFENDNSMNLVHTMHINISDLVFQSIISDIFKNSLSCSSSHHENVLKLMKSNHNNHNGQLFYSCLTHQSVKFQWSINVDPFNIEQEKEKNKEAINQDNNSYNSNNYTWCFTISSICLKTLWSLYKAIELRQKASLPKNNSIATFKRPTVEQLRLECFILKQVACIPHDDTTLTISNE